MNPGAPLDRATGKDLGIWCGFRELFGDFAFRWPKACARTEGAVVRVDVRQRSRVRGVITHMIRAVAIAGFSHVVANNI